MLLEVPWTLKCLDFFSSVEGFKAHRLCWVSEMKFVPFLGLALAPLVGKRDGAAAQPGAQQLRSLGGRAWSCALPSMKPASGPGSSPQTCLRRCAAAHPSPSSAGGSGGRNCNENSIIRTCFSSHLPRNHPDFSSLMKPVNL